MNITKEYNKNHDYYLEHKSSIDKEELIKTPFNSMNHNQEVLIKRAKEKKEDWRKSFSKRKDIGLGDFLFILPCMVILGLFAIVFFTSGVLMSYHIFAESEITMDGFGWLPYILSYLELAAGAALIMGFVTAVAIFAYGVITSEWKRIFKGE